MKDMLGLFIRQTLDEARVKGIDWDNQPLGMMSDTELAKKLGVSKATVQAARYKRGIPAFDVIDWDKEPLGKMSDGMLAAKKNVKISTVAAARHTRGIPAYVPPTDRPLQFSNTPKGIDWDNVPLGKKPDSVIAKELGVSHPAVLRARVARNIPPFTTSTRKGINWDDAENLEFLQSDLPNKEVADLFGVAASVIIRARRCRGLISKDRDRKK